jgi:Na+/proline symporter
MLGLLILLIYSVTHLGGIESAVAAIDIERLSFRAPDESLLARLDTWMVPIIGSLVAQELLSRIFACRSASVARNAGMFAAALYLSVGLIPVFLGLLGPSFSLSQDHYDQFLPILASELLPPVMYIIFCGALLSAILSTVDTTLLVVSSLVSQNFIRVLRPNYSEKTMVLWSRGIVVLAGLAALGLALGAESIYSLVELSSSLGAAGVLVITFAGLYSRWGGSATAIFTLIVGMISLPIAEYWLEWDAPFMTSIAAALVAFTLGALLERSSGVEDEAGEASARPLEA